MRPEPCIYVVDDDQTVRNALTWLLRASGFQVVACESAEDFLEVQRPEDHGCVLLDCKLPGMSGLDVIRTHLGSEVQMPVIMLSSQRDLEAAVAAMRDGARDYLVKPANPSHILEVVEAAIEADAVAWQLRREREETRDQLESLTVREREVLGALVRGMTNKDAGDFLGISPRTVEVHRSRIMEKMGTDSLVDLAAKLARHDCKLS
jgi:two-component system response regulator FixJ